MKTKIFIYVFILSFSSISSQNCIKREKIKFYVDDILLTKQQSDSISIIVKHNNNLSILNDSVCFEDTTEISLYFIIYDRVMEFHGINPVIFSYDYIFYEFGYNHIDKFIPFTKENMKDTFYEEYKRKKHRKNRYFPPLDREHDWYFAPMSINGQKINPTDIFHGIAYFTHSETEFNLTYHDFKQCCASTK